MSTESWIRGVAQARTWGSAACTTHRPGPGCRAHPLRRQPAPLVALQNETRFGAKQRSPRFLGHGSFSERVREVGRTLRLGWNGTCRFTYRLYYATWPTIGTKNRLPVTMRSTYRSAEEMRNFCGILQDSGANSDPLVSAWSVPAQVARWAAVKVGGEINRRS